MRIPPWYGINLNFSRRKIRFYRSWKNKKPLKSSILSPIMSWWSESLFSISKYEYNHHIFTFLAFFMVFLSLEDEKIMLFKMSGTSHQVMWHYIAEDKDLYYTDVESLKKLAWRFTLEWVQDQEITLLIKGFQFSWLFLRTTETYTVTILIYLPP